ncbi:MAG: bifunctional UDP-sugar hydrolase/5'-nucleotidase [Candidatus Aminicenantes bacterium]|nr:bifunctional UDP-sugar hydrolase/5'-nucleotidase [Candidatus Aminicenantes bacterium]
MNIKKHIFTAFLIVFIAGLFFSTLVFGASRSETIVIFHMNDIHAQIDNFAKIATVIDNERKKNPNVFFMNAGDNFSGNPVVDQYIPKGEPILQLLNRLKVNVLELGNHEFDYGQEILKDAMKKARYPMICANVKVVPGEGGGAILPQPKPYVILKTKKGTKIAVLGVIQTEKDSHIPSTHPSKLKGLAFSDGIDAAQQYRYLKKKSNIFIALTHLGADGDEVLAQKIPELDIIVGGHSHTTIRDPKETNGVLITQAGSNAKFLGRIELTVTNGKITGKKGELIDVASLAVEDPEIKAMITKFNDNPEFNRIITTLPMELFGPDELGNLITDAVRNIDQLDMAFHNQGGIRLDRLGPEVRLKNIYKMLPFDNDIVLFEMTPAEIKTLLQHTYRKENGFDLKVSGIEYTVLVTPGTEPGKPFKVKDIELRDEVGNLLDESKTYKVGINDYIAARYTFTHRDPGKALKTLLAPLLIDYLQKGGDVCKNIKKIRTHEKEVNE